MRPRWPFDPSTLRQAQGNHAQGKQAQDSAMDEALRALRNRLDAL